MCVQVGMSGRGRAGVRLHKISSLVQHTMSEKEVHPSVAQHIIIKFLPHDDVKPAEILQRLTAQFRDETMSMLHVFAWHKQITSGCERVQNESHNHHPWTNTTEQSIDAVHKLLEGDQCLAVSKISSIVGISMGVLSLSSWWSQCSVKCVPNESCIF